MKKIILLITIIATASFAARIGVLKADKNKKCSEEILIDLDTEDSHGDTHVVSGDENPPGISLGGHAKFTYCVLNVSTMPKSPFDYAVLRLDNDCPKGGLLIGRHHDTEDSHNANSSKGNIYPNVVNKNATLEYCFVKKTSKPDRKYPFDKAYGVFANPSDKTNMKHSKIKIDDEDDNGFIGFGYKCVDPNKNNPNPAYEPSNHTYDETYGSSNSKQVSYCYPRLKYDKNANYWIWPDNFVDTARVQKIMSGTVNTTYHVTWWTGSSSAILAKSANMEYAVADNHAISAPVAATVRNVTRSGMDIDLKTAGDVEISLVGINGSSVVKIARQNMQPGVHSISWSSANVPNGRYIAVIKQNGMVRGKNIILK